MSVAKKIPIIRITIPSINKRYPLYIISIYFYFVLFSEFGKKCLLFSESIYNDTYLNPYDMKNK